MAGDPLLRILRPGLVSVVQSGFTSVQIADNTMGVFGGFIVNPFSSEDQGLNNAEGLYVNIITPNFQPFETLGTIRLAPGQSYLVPPLTNVWVNAKTSGHKFTCYFSAEYQAPFPPIIVPGQPGSGTLAAGSEPGSGTFPPPGVTGLTTVIPSYLYQQYTDDDDLWGWIDAQNEMQQNFVDTFNALNLPIYPGPIVANELLDWVARGLYGMARPALGSGIPNIMGPLNTFGPNWLVPMWDFGVAAPTLEYQGYWTVDSNIPDLTPRPNAVPPFPSVGWWWTAKTLNPHTPNSAPSGLPGIGGDLIYNGDYIYWDAVNQVYVQEESSTILAKFGLNIVAWYGPENVVIANDDVYRRVLTWHFYKGDGKYFSVPWFKRRIWGFLYGKDGWRPDHAADPTVHPPDEADEDDAFIANTEQISISIGVNRNMTIRFVLGKRTTTGGAMCNVFGCNGFGINSSPESFQPGQVPDKHPPVVSSGPMVSYNQYADIQLNDIGTWYEHYPPLPFMYIFKQALESGVLEVPYQFNFTCNIG